MNLFLIAGVSGSGKSTIARLIAPKHTHAADDYFYDDEGNYNFNPKDLGLAHGVCQRLTELDMKEGRAAIAVHNTFTQAWHKKPYLDLAEKYGYTVHHLIADGDFKDTHGVPTNTLANQAKDFQFNNQHMRRSWNGAQQG